MLGSPAVARSRSRLASNISHDTLFVPRGVRAEKQALIDQVLTVLEHEERIRHGTETDFVQL
jgi:hypothetical protein